MFSDLVLHVVQLLALSGAGLFYSYVSAFVLITAASMVAFAGALSAAKSMTMWIYLATLGVAGGISLGLCTGVPG
ncbi:MAG: hypothetical protein AAGE61_08325 [Pseudomonadota bacterium]